MNDFPTTLKVQVTEEDITDGIRGETTSCALARAVRRHYPAAEVEVELSGITISDPDLGTAEYLVTQKAYDFIEKFDRSPGPGIVINDACGMDGCSTCEPGKPPAPGKFAFRLYGE